MARPVVSLGYLKSWAEQNHVSDDVLLIDENGQPIVDLSDGEEHQGRPALALQITYG